MVVDGDVDTTDAVTEAGEATEVMAIVHGATEAGEEDMVDIGDKLNKNKPQKISNP